MSDLLTLSKNFGVLENANINPLRVVANRISIFFSLGSNVNHFRRVLRVDDETILIDLCKISDQKMTNELKKQDSFYLFSEIGNILV
jgi:hypothetical protein